VRSLSRFVLAAWLGLASAVSNVGAVGPLYAQSDGSTGESAPTDVAPPADVAEPSDDAQPAAPIGPNLQASDYAPVVCTPGSAGFRYVEVRGSGFDAWATQRLVGNVVDGNGLSQMQWGSVWVSPQGRLTLEVNLCADPFRNRPALPAGNYTVMVGPGSGQPIAATSIALSPPPEPPGEDDESLPAVMPPAAASATAPAPTAIPFVLPNITANPTPTPLPMPTLSGGIASPGTSSSGTAWTGVAAPALASAPRTGPGSPSQPFPLGAPGTLDDGWQLVVTGVTPDAWSGIHSAVPSTNPPASDQRDYMVRVQATFMGQGTGVFSGMRLALVSGIKTTYDQLHNACGTVPDMVPPNLVTPSGSVRGNLCFTVRASDVDSLTLFDNQSTEPDRVYFALK
jgi:hypothetical protein